MSAASSSALEKANQFDLRPAMKRPQTNLQTARRLITSHLGAKSKVSKEQSAKEREDLRIAKGKGMSLFGTFFRSKNIFELHPICQYMQIKTLIN